MGSNVKTPVEKIIEHLLKYSFPVTVGEKEEWLEYEETFVRDKLFIEEANNEMLIQELNSQKTHIQNLIDSLKETEKQLRDIYNTVEFEGKFPVRSALDNAKELIDQYDSGFL